jgi:hypothetical protein
MRLGAEGIVSKRVDGTYRSGPCRVWIKIQVVRVIYQYAFRKIAENTSALASTG